MSAMDSAPRWMVHRCCGPAVERAAGSAVDKVTTETAQAHTAKAARRGGLWPWLGCAPTPGAWLGRQVKLGIWLRAMLIFITGDV